ncbi:MAG: L-threonylcarbamoyladenylate synthase [Halobacteriaceae archaeon]
MTVTDTALDRAATAIRRGDLVVYPTETVYGLGADALDPTAIDRVYEVKRRPRENPLSLAVPTVEAAHQYVTVDALEHRFMRAFLPGPVTVVCRKQAHVPAELTAGRDRVGVRVPDHPVARALLDRVAPITATSANVSGTGSVRRIQDLSVRVRDAAATVLDDGETPGTESTVVDVAAGEILRRGAMADAIEAWFSEE